MTTRPLLTIDKTIALNINGSRQRIRSPIDDERKVRKERKESE